MRIQYIDFLVTGDRAAARDIAERALVARKFRLTWHNDDTAAAERGPKEYGDLKHGLGQYFKVTVLLMSARPGETIVRIKRESAGRAGGLLGAARTNQKLGSLRRKLEGIFADAGVLRSVSEG